MTSKTSKKKGDLSSRVNSARDTAPPGTEKKGIHRNIISIWPEWNDSDINSEKWEGAKSGKEKEKGKSPNQHFFDDPEGKVELPITLKTQLSGWKRSIDVIVDRTPVIVEDPNAAFDIMSLSESIHNSELMRSIVAQITTLYHLNTNTALSAEHSVLQSADLGVWKPWEHIYALCKVGKGSHLSLYNSYGKYVVRLYWMKSWRKIVVDDTIPVDSEDNILLPRSSSEHELWPMLLSKAILKVASLDYAGGDPYCEYGDVSIMHLLTGWLPEPIPLQYGKTDEIWNLLQSSIAEFRLPETPMQLPAPDLSPRKDGVCKSEKKPEPNAMPKGVEMKSPQVVVYVSYQTDPPSPVKVSKLGEIADASEKLRQSGLSHVFPHPLLLKRTRSCPLVPPPAPPVVPPWKLIRQKKKMSTLLDEAPQKEEEPRIDQWVELSSPYINYKVCPSFVPNGKKKTGSSAGSHSDSSSAKPVPITMGVVSEDDEKKIDDKDEDEIVISANQIEPIPLEALTERLPDVVSSRPPTRERPSSKGSSTTKETRGSRRTTGEPGNRGKLSSNKSPSVRLTQLNRDKPNSITSSRRSHNDVDEEIVHGFEEVPSPVKKEDLQWMHYDDFCKCFQRIHMFHKSSTYEYTHRQTDLRLPGAAPTTASSKKGTTPSGRGMTSPGLQNSYDEKIAQFLFVDSLESIELLVSLQVVCKWLEPPSDAKDLGLLGETGSNPEKVKRIQSGSLLAEPYSWKSLITGQPVLCISTTGVKSALLTLKPGRHVLKFIINAPIGWHVEICSMTPFVYGDEESVIGKLVKESCRFISHASNIALRFGNFYKAFGNLERSAELFRLLRVAYQPDIPEGSMSAFDVDSVFFQAVCLCLADLMGEDFNQAFVHYLRALLMDTGTGNILKLVGKRQCPDVGSPLAENSREISENEIEGLIKIQSTWKGHYARFLHKARNSKYDEHLPATEMLTKMWSIIEPLLDSFGRRVFRTMFKVSPGLMSNYSFHKDEWNRIAYSDYQGAFPDQPSHSWFLVFRSIFYSEEAVRVVPKLFCSIPTALLRVVDNDTGREVKRVFQKVIPFVYRKNNRGYTFMVEARTSEFPLLPGKWKMRLIGSINPLLAPSSDILITNFNYKYFKDYYIPNEDNTIFRYAVKTTADHLGSVQATTSNPDVYIKLQVLDNEKPLLTVHGKGQAVIPAWLFYANDLAEAEDKGKKKGSKKSSEKLDKKTPSPTGSAKISRPRSQSSASEEETHHKYILKASVERNSWPLTTHAWEFVQTMKDHEREDLKVFTVHRPASKTSLTGASSKTSVVATKKGRDKGAKDKAAAKPSSAKFDFDKPHFTLRYVVDGDDSSAVRVEKDVERREAIKALKRAWEDAEPGRAAKATETRQKFLQEWLVPNQELEPLDVSEVEEPGKLSIPPSTAEGSEYVPPPSVNPPEEPPTTLTLKPLDTSQHTVYYSSEGDVHVMDEEEEAKQLEAKIAEIQDYKSFRQEVKKWRQNQFQLRNDLKAQQLDECESLQQMVNRFRKEVSEPREAFRQSILEAEQKRIEALQAMEEELAEAAKVGKGNKKGSGKKGKEGAKGKDSGKRGKGSGKGKKK